MEGAGYGALAGVALVAVEVIGAAAAGLSPIAPFRMAASLLLGVQALEPAAYDGLTAGSALVFGLFVHLVLSAAFGAAYGLIMGGRSYATRTSLAAQSGLGIGFGAALWLINFHVIARAWCPWFLDTNQLVQALMHGLAFGLPLGVMHSMAELRAELTEPAWQVR